VPGSYLEAAVERVAMTDHVGKSGAGLERVLLPDGRRLVVKRLDPAHDLVMWLTGDTRGRELDLWAAGHLDALPPGLAHVVVDGWREPDGTATLVMRDLGDAVLGWEDRLDGRRWRFVVERLGRLHRTFLDRAPTGLADLAVTLTLFAPERLRLAGHEDNPLAGLALRGWERFADLVDATVVDAVHALLADPAPLVRALLARPCTLVHGDLATVNMALEGDDLVLLDWAMPVAAPGALDLTRFVAGCAQVVDVPREQMLADYRAAAGPACDDDAMDLALLAALIWLGWNKALDAADHPDPAVRAREVEGLRWWVDAGRHALERGLLR